MKKIALFLAILFLVQAPFSQAALTDVVGTSYEEAVETLTGLGIISGYEDGTFRPDNTITRAEFASLAARISGYTETMVASQSLPFRDVAADHWAKGPIGFLTAQGIISGLSSREFGPENPITYEQAIKVLIGCLGYEVQAKAKGGYPSGYVMTANEIGMLKGLKGAGMTQSAIRGNLAVMIYNAIHLPKYVQTSFGNDSISIEPQGTLLEENLMITRYDGVITANKVTEIAFPGGTGTDQIRLTTPNGNHHLFHVGETNAADFIGYPVNLYVREEAGDLETVLFLRKDTAKFNELVIQGGLAKGIENQILTYHTHKDQDKELEARIRRGADVIYNGVSYQEFSEEDLLIKTGTMTLLDTNRDNVYETILISEFRTVVMAQRYPAVNVITDQFSPARNLVFDQEDTSNVNVAYKFDQEMSVDVFNEWDVLSVYESKNLTGTKVTKVYATNDEVTGVLEKRDDDILTINGQDYEISGDYKAHAAAIGSFTVGQNSTFLLDRDGKIIATKKATSGTMEYAYVVAASSKEVTDETQVKLYTQSGILDIYDVNTRFRLDGATVSKGSQLITALKNAKYGTDSSKHKDDLSQLIRVKINENALITDIDTAMPNVNSDEEQLVLNYDKERMEFDQHCFVFDGKAILTDSTKLFIIPDNLNDTAGYKLLPYAQLVNGVYAVSIFDLERNGQAGAAVIVGDTVMEFQHDDIWSVFEKRTQAISEEGAVVDKLYFVNSNGAQETVIVTEKSTFWNFASTSGQKISSKDLNPGDVVRFSINKDKGTLVQLERLFAIKNLKTLNREVMISGVGNDKYNYLLRVVVGRPVLKSNSSALVNINYTLSGNQINKDVFWNLGTGKIKYILCEETQDGSFRIRPGSINDVLDIETVGSNKASYLVAKSRYAEMQEIYIFNFIDDPMTR